MKRSQINQIMRSADEFIRQQGLYLPPFAYWSPEDWAAKGDEAREIVEASLGWDITDYGLDDYEHQGLFLFTIRNGRPDAWKTKQGKLYAEKLLIQDVQQITPMHFHWTKMEDIINRGGGTLVLQLYNSTPDEELDTERPVEISTDGVRRTIPAGGIVRLDPGESITLVQGMYHKFWAEGGKVLIGEVSLVNDDFTDNRFAEPTGRFPDVEDDEPPLHLLITDYPKYYKR